jgi:hypothetical protein
MEANGANAPLSPWFNVGISGHLELVSQFVLALENPEEKELDCHGSADMVDAMERAQRSHMLAYFRIM